MGLQAGIRALLAPAPHALPAGSGPLDPLPFSPGELILKWQGQESRSPRAQVIQESTLGLKRNAMMAKPGAGAGKASRLTSY